MLLQLTNTDVMDYACGKCFKTRLRSRMQPGQSVAFFTPIDFNGRGGIAIQDPQGESYSLGYVRVLNTRAHPICFKTDAVDFLKSHVGANHERISLQFNYIRHDQPTQSSLAKVSPNRRCLGIQKSSTSSQSLSKSCGRIHGQHDAASQITNVWRFAGNPHFQPARCASSSDVRQNSQSGRVPPLGFGRAGTTANQSAGRNGSIALWPLVNDISKRKCGAESGSSGSASVSTRGIAAIFIQSDVGQLKTTTVNHIELRKALRSSFKLVLNVARQALAEIAAGAAIACAMTHSKYEARVL